MKSPDDFSLMSLLFLAFLVLSWVNPLSAFVPKTTITTSPVPTCIPTTRRSKSSSEIILQHIITRSGPHFASLEDREVSEGINKNEAKDKNDDKDANCRECLYIEKPEYGIGTKPESALMLGVGNFLRQGKSIIVEALAELGIVADNNYIPPAEKPPNCLGLTLDSEAVKEAERKRESQRDGKVETNPVSRFMYDVGCFALDELFDDQPIARFWFLETIARVPYFSYVSMLHLYESFGWWREPELRKIHYAEEYNELHHLLIMEALGGNERWKNRFLAYHVAIGYYWAVNALFFFSPRAAYEFMELLEAHAVDTYSTFFKENKERLKTLPAPRVARSYYKAADLYLFDDFQVGMPPGSRRPPCDNLYDVFKNICEDEAEHVKTMSACKDYAKVGRIVTSPHVGVIDETESSRGEKRKAWLEWSDGINQAITNEISETE